MIFNLADTNEEEDEEEVGASWRVARAVSRLNNKERRDHIT